MKLSAKARKLAGHPYCSAVVLAAGSSVRMGQDKMLLDLGGAPVVIRTLQVIEACACIDEIILVCRTEQIAQLARMCRDYGILKVRKVIAGGDTRLASALAGVSETSAAAKLIAIHDGARPLVTQPLVAETVHRAALDKAAAPAVPVKDTIKKAADGIVEETPERATLYAVQTPQVFWADLIKGALTSAFTKGEAPTDDCAAVEALGVRVHLTAGSDENIKITTPTDLMLARAIYSGRKDL